jgi:hypothetical protein
MDDIIIQIIAQGVLLLYPAWRIYKKAGLNPAISFTVLIPGFGILICALILIFSKWQVTPARGN